MANFATMIIFFLQMGANAQGKICAKNYLDLEKSERLKNLKNVLPESGERGFVNKTKGSYFIINYVDGHFAISFYTTGLFDLYGIHREGPVEFCDESGKIIVLGLGRTKVIHLKENRLIFDDGADNKSFTPGDMPIFLREKNK